MLQDVFRQGHLDMPVTAPDPVDVAVVWKDLPVNRISCIISIFVWLLLMASYLNILPSLIYCLQRAKGNISIEHNLSLSRTRNLLAAWMFLPACILADRYRLVRESWRFVAVGDSLSLAVTAGVLLVFILGRVCLSCILPQKKFHTEERLAVRRTFFNVFLLVIPIMLATGIILSLCGLTDTVTAYVLKGEAAVAAIVITLREIEILSSRCSAFSTFLYLCALEILPDCLLIAESL